MKRAYEDLICSKALRIQPIENQWEYLTSRIDNCLLYIDLTNQLCVAAWFRDHSLKQNRICGHEFIVAIGDPFYADRIR
jgi:hypothetical protein